MKTKLACYILLLLIFGCSKSDEKPNHKVSFNYTAAEANANSSQFTYYGDTFYYDIDDAVLLTPSSSSVYGGAFFKTQEDISTGFEVEFEFSITNQGGITDCYDYPGGDGLAFVLIAGSTVQVSSGGGIGYAGTANSMAFEIDTWCNYDLGDPDGNHISIHNNGADANSANEDYSIGGYSVNYDMSDGAIHTFRIYYKDKKMDVYLDNSKILSSGTSSFDLADYLTMTNSLVYGGFTSSTGSAYEQHNIHSFKWTIF